MPFIMLQLSILALVTPQYNLPQLVYGYPEFLQRRHGRHAVKFIHNSPVYSYRGVAREAGHHEPVCTLAFVPGQVLAFLRVQS